MRDRPHAHTILIAIVLFLLLALTPRVTRGAEIRWLCWESTHDDSIRCLLDRSALQPATAQRRAADAERRRLAASLPPNMPAFAREMRLDPARFAGREIKIPLLGPAVEPEFVRELAESVMCGSRAACSVAFSNSPLSERLLSIIDDDPALK